MKALYFEAFGGPDVFQPGTLPMPDLVDGHLLVDVHHAGINPMDWKVPKATYVKMFEHQFPIVAGFDFAGTVRAVGGGGERFRGR